jgi:nucleotide-binding universal stress UspA family protein/quercetin dioxygenase-like cupin family protein
MSSIQTILHPTDFSPDSDYAFRLACSLAKDYNARLYLLHVRRASAAPMVTEPEANPLEPAEAQNALQGKFSWPQPRDPSVRVEHRVADGEAAEEILRLAQAIQCDLIVMGTHGRAGLKRLLTGSVAEEVLRRAACPVMTIRNAPVGAVPLPPQAKPLAKPGEIVDVRPLGTALAATSTGKVLASHGLEVTRLILPAGKEIFEYKSKGTFVIHCLEGRVNVTALGKTQQLEAGQFLYLHKEEPHTIKAIEDASMLVTIASS